ncbi:MAG: hypothetical protein D6712_16245 [Chloroflexi bacterium]|nr:MAG: hypothetical protein D6712_16245 [Chloroflexota bacterium]
MLAIELMAWAAALSQAYLTYRIAICGDDGKVVRALMATCGILLGVQSLIAGVAFNLAYALASLWPAAAYRLGPQGVVGGTIVIFLTATLLLGAPHGWAEWFGFAICIPLLAFSSGLATGQPWHRHYTLTCALLLPCVLWVHVVLEIWPVALSALLGIITSAWTLARLTPRPIADG